MTDIAGLEQPGTVLPPGRSPVAEPDGDGHDPAVIDQILAAFPLHEVASRLTALTRRANGSYKGCCPLHMEGLPSFTITSPALPPSRQRARCRGCGFEGDAIDLHAAHAGLSRREMVKHLVGALGIAPQATPAPVNDQQENVPRAVDKALPSESNIAPVVQDHAHSVDEIDPDRTFRFAEHACFVCKARAHFSFVTHTSETWTCLGHRAEGRETLVAPDRRHDQTPVVRHTLLEDF